MLDLPEVDPWFVVASAGDGITHVAEPHVHPLLRCNVWHVRGRTRDLVVDTSLGLRPLRHLVEQALDHELLAVATHVHGDHVGGMYEFDARAIHSSEAAELAEPGLVLQRDEEKGTGLPDKVGAHTPRKTRHYMFPKRTTREATRRAPAGIG